MTNSDDDAMAIDDMLMQLTMIEMTIEMDYADDDDEVLGK